MCNVQSVAASHHFQTLPTVFDDRQGLWLSDKQGSEEFQSTVQCGRKNFPLVSVHDLIIQLTVRSAQNAVKPDRIL